MRRKRATTSRCVRSAEIRASGPYPRAPTRRASGGASVTVRTRSSSPNTARSSPSPIRRVWGLGVHIRGSQIAMSPPGANTRRASPRALRTSSGERIADSTVKSTTSEQPPACTGRLRTSPATTRAPGTRSPAAATRSTKRSTPISRSRATPSRARRSSHQPVPQPASSTDPPAVSAPGASSSSVRTTSSRIAALPALPAFHAQRRRRSSL
jgi:hypothetical protein